MSELKQTSLYQKHLELNAKMVDFGGWEMPIQYQNLKEEVLLDQSNQVQEIINHLVVVNHKLNGLDVNLYKEEVIRHILIVVEVHYQ